MHVLAAFAAEEGEGGSAVEFPPIENVVEWPAFFGEGQFFEFNKIGLIGLIAFGVPVLMFLMARTSSPSAPRRRNTMRRYRRRSAGSTAMPGRAGCRCATGCPSSTP